MKALIDSLVHGRWVTIVEEFERAKVARVVSAHETYDGQGTIEFGLITPTGDEMRVTTSSQCKNDGSIRYPVPVVILRSTNF